MEATYNWNYCKGYCKVTVNDRIIVQIYSFVSQTLSDFMIHWLSVLFRRRWKGRFISSRMYLIWTFNQDSGWWTMAFFNSSD